MIVAISILVLIATIGALTLNLSAQSAKSTSDYYLRSQANTLVQSATEYALLVMSGYSIEDNGNCINSIDINFSNSVDNIFDINISIFYIGKTLPSSCAVLSDNIDTNESNLTVLIDTVVKLKSGVSLEPIRVHRRTLQKL